MTAHVARSDLECRARLFEPGERLGWIFRDRMSFIRPFTDPQPARKPVPAEIVNGAAQAAAKHSLRVKRTVRYGIKIAALFLVLSACSAVASSDAAGGFFMMLVVTVAACGLIIGLSHSSKQSSINAVGETERRLAAEHERQLEHWKRAKEAHHVAERQRVDQLDEWGAARIPTGKRRIDVFGGSLWGWQAFLSVYGTSALVERPVIVADLSQELVCDELLSLAAAAGVPVDAQLLPDQLATTSLLYGLPARQLTDALIESMYGGDNSASVRSERAMDDRILSKVCDALGEDLSLRRVAGALRALMDEPDDSGALTAKERRFFADELFGVDYRRQAADALRRLEAHIQPMEALGSEHTPRQPGYLTCVALASGGRSVRGEFLTDIIVQWLTHQVVDSGSAISPEVIIAGADKIELRNLEHLANACERRGVRLTLLFRHLRESGQRMIGGGAVGFMRLGNHDEATQAANFIGRQHKFVVSQLTRTLGGNETHTGTESYGESETESISVNVTTGWSSSSGSNWSSNGNGGNSSSSRSFSRSEGHSSSTGRNWSTSKAHALGSNWSDAESRQRVHEYSVEPGELQQLPDHAMVLVQPKHGGNGPALVAVEFDPAIVTLPRVSMQPLSDDVAGPARSRETSPQAHQQAVSFQHTGQQVFDQPVSGGHRPLPYGTPGH